MIEVKDSLQFLKEQKEFDTNIIYADPPYALGSKIGINEDGKVDYIKAKDFMDKWEMPTGEYWEQWFKEAYRTLKHGGYCVMFGMDRQLLLFKYYAHLAGFQENQSLYWYFISNFPKATDLSNMIAKRDGSKRDGAKRDGAGSQGNTFPIKNTYQEYTKTGLAKKYEGYKYSISPLKQTNETIMVFQKPYKTGSGLHDTLAYEDGDDTCCCGALDIDGNRVAFQSKEDKDKVILPVDGSAGYKHHSSGMSGMIKRMDIGNVAGRYPSQTFCDSNTAAVLDKQSGLKCGQQGAIKGTEPSFNKDVDLYGDFSGYGKTSEPRNDKGGCSKILHKCDFENGEHDLYFYNPKVSKKERNAGCDGNEQQYSHDGRNKEIENPYQRNKSVAINNHPTLKPIKLNERILKLFKTPNEQKILYPFAGSGSEIIGGIKAGFTNWSACEINPDYVKIAKARIKHWTEQDKQITIDDL